MASILKVDALTGVTTAGSISVITAGILQGVNSKFACHYARSPCDVTKHLLSSTEE